jgi:O-antigen chain-terminating methyltransferase
MKSQKQSGNLGGAARYPLRVAKHIANLPNTATNLTNDVHALREDLKHALTSLKEEDSHLRNKAEFTEQFQDDIKHRMDQLDRRLSDMMHQLTIMSEEQRAASKGKGGKTAEADKPATTSSELVADEHLLDEFYVEFERWFRGTDEEIAERQKVYMPYFTESKIDSKKYPAIDIGCGRGEFIQLLKDNGVRGIGLDINKAMVERTREKGLEAAEGDALTYLRAQKTSSLMAITGFHIVEHIPFLDLVRIFDECYRVLQPGGFIIFETPNPENVIVGSCNFYADPSHLHPLPPAFLDFALKTRGFNKTEVKRLHPIKAKIKATDPLVKEMAERIYGPQDYAVIAYK